MAKKAKPLRKNRKKVAEGRGEKKEFFGSNILLAKKKKREKKREG